MLGTTAQFFAYPKVAAAGSSGVVVVTFDQQTESVAILKSASSVNGGANWSALQYLDEGHYPNLDTGPDSQWQGWPDVAVDTDGETHCVFDYDSNYIACVSSSPDTVAPRPLVSFAALPSDSTVYLSWTNPPDPDFARAIVRVRTDTYPLGPADGSLVCSRAGAAGSADSFLHTQLTNGTTYYYSAYACDAAGNCSAPSTANAAPFAVTCADARRLADSTPVTLNAKVVSANFAGTDGCVYVQEPQGQSGIRVVSTDAIPAGVGDVVAITGVAQGSVPNHPEWTTNRAYMRIRDWGI